MHLFDSARAKCLKTCCFQAFPTSGRQTGQVRLQTRPLATTLFPIGPALVHTITTHFTQTFQNTVSLFISLSDQVKRRVSGPTPPAGLGCKGHLRSRVLFFVCLFVSVRNINTRDQTTARHSQPQKPCTDHTDFLGGFCVFWSYIDIFTSMFSNNNLSPMPKKYTVINDLL